MILQALAFAIGSILIMVLAERVIADIQGRQSQAGSVLVAGLLGLSYLIAMLYAAGAL